MASVAEQLRDAREAQSFSVQQLAEITKIKTDHLQALELGEFGSFAAPVYIRGFVRTYAGVLKLDVTQIMAQLDAELSQSARFRDPPSLLGRPQGPLDKVMYQLSKLDWRKALIVAGVVGLMGLGFWGYHQWQTGQSKDTLTDLGPGLYRPPANSSAEMLPLPNKSPKR